MKRYTVKITKQDGMKSTYFVLAHSAGGAENICLDSVFNAQFALAENGWPKDVNLPDLYTKQVANSLVSYFCTGETYHHIRN